MCGEEVEKDDAVRTRDMEVVHADCCFWCVECDEWVKEGDELRDDTGEVYCEECFAEVKACELNEDGEGSPAFDDLIAASHKADDKRSGDEN